jgi:hypothetical protein
VKFSDLSYPLSVQLWLLSSLGGGLCTSSLSGCRHYSRSTFRMCPEPGLCIQSLPSSPFVSHQRDLPPDALRLHSWFAPELESSSHPLLLPHMSLVNTICLRSRRTGHSRMNCTEIFVSFAEAAAGRGDLLVDERRPVTDMESEPGLCFCL